jgi:hypothetical protein
MPPSSRAQRCQSGIGKPHLSSKHSIHSPLFVYRLLDLHISRQQQRRWLLPVGRQHSRRRPSWYTWRWPSHADRWAQPHTLTITPFFHPSTPSISSRCPIPSRSREATPFSFHGWHGMGHRMWHW